jgi:integrase
VQAEDPRSAVVLAPYLDKVRHQQLFFGDMEYRRTAPPRRIPRRYGARGRPCKPAPAPAARPVTAWVQPSLFDAGRRVYHYARDDLRSGPPPENPWLAWALYLAHTAAEARGWEPVVRRGMQRVLVMLLAEYRDGDRIRVSDFAPIVVDRCTNLDHVVEILTTMSVVDDDRPAVLEPWLADKLVPLAAGIAGEVHAWARVLRDGGPRSHPRTPGTVRAYLTAILPALTDWSGRYHHLREVTRDDVLSRLDGLSGNARETALSGLRSLFGWAKRDGRIFRDPTARISNPPTADPLWQPLRPHELTQAIEAATTPQAKVFVVLAAVHAARPGQIRAMQVDDVDLAKHRIRIAGHDRPLDDLTRQAILDWLTYRRQRWPNTANPHLLVSKDSALGHGPVSHRLVLNLQGLTATIERLRIDRQLEEALVAEGDPLHIAAVFGISESTAIRYAVNARMLLAQPEALRPAPTTQAPSP